MLKVYCIHHNEYGFCTLDDYNDSKSGANPSGMLRVEFNTFTQAVPLNTITLVDDEEPTEADYWSGEAEYPQ